MMRGECEGGGSPASIWINSRKALAAQGLWEWSDIFCEDTVSQKIRRFEAVKKAFLTASTGAASAAPVSVSSGGETVKVP